MIIGIDLGTTNSAAAAWIDGQAVLIPNRLGQVLTPSAVSFDGDRLVVGLAARERQATHPRNTATAFKRYIGTSRRALLGGREYAAEDLSALVLRSLKEDAEAHFGERVTEAVITVPAYFNEKQRKATRRAGELAGLKVERLLNEPTAAALAYGIHQLTAESRFLVFDLGGGTFDVSVLEIFEGIIEVRSSTGDARLGGEDFNEVLIALFCERLGGDWVARARSDQALYQKFREQAERARRALSTAGEITMELVWRDQLHQVGISAADFESRVEPLIARLREPVLRSLRDSAIRPDNLSEVILIGGATRMPVVRKAVARMFGRFPNASVNPDEAVALGAAVQAGLKARDAALREVVLTDVCPFSLGVATSERLPNGNFQDGIFSPIIERNTAIPASRVKSYFTLAPNQAAVKFDVYQGEARMVSDNVKIADLEIRMPRGPAGVQIDCRFSYDINGLLEVDVHIPSNGHNYQLVIADSDESERSADVQERREALAKLKVHPRDTEGNRAVMARAERCWQNALGDNRELIGEWISQFNVALATQDNRIIDRAREQFDKALDQIDGDSFL